MDTLNLNFKSASGYFNFFGIHHEIIFKSGHQEFLNRVNPTLSNSSKVFNNFEANFGQ
jgi:hypothetical protein